MEEKSAETAVGMECSVAFPIENGEEIHGSVRKLERFQAVFEVLGPLPALRVSEVIKDFRILMNGRQTYSGRSVVENVISQGAVTHCVVGLQGEWQDADAAPVVESHAAFAGDFSNLIQRWQRFYRLRKDYKELLTDMQSFLTDLESWLQMMEFRLPPPSSPGRKESEQRLALELKKLATPALDSLFERFESVTREIEPGMSSAYRVLCRRLLHRFLLGSPFMHRIYSKPLGYAGDYEMMNMIWRNEAAGDSLFARLLNAYILDQAPARSVRNRVEYMTRRIAEETMRVSTAGRTAHIYSLGCGPAREVENFLAQSLSDHARFTMMDFNEETLAYTKGRMEAARRTHLRRTQFELIKRSVYYLLKDSVSPGQPKEQFDLIYSSGLYDYLNDRVSRAVNTHLYERLSPGGVLIISNFEPSNPIRNLMEYAFEWFLIHRNRQQMQAIGPEQVPIEECVVRADPTGCNVFLEVRKPESSL